MVSGDTRRVLRVITRLNVGGPARQALLLARELRPAWTTTLLAGRPAATEGELGDPDVVVTPVPLVRELHPIRDTQAIVQVGRAITRVRPHIVHSHMAKAGTIARLAALRSSHRPKTVHTFHGHVLDGYFTGPTERAFVQTERWLAGRTDLLIAVSPQIRDQLLDLRIGTQSQYRVVTLGLDLDPFFAVDRPSGPFREAIGVSRTTPLVGVIGRLVPIKDHRTLFNAFAEVPEAHLAVLGDGPLRAELEALARAPSLRGRVHFTGIWADVAGALADLDLVALTSRNEGTPVSLIEAAAAARASVATDVGGVRTVVEDGVTGLLAPAGDVSAIAAAITRLLADRPLAVRYGAAARARAAQFTADRLVAEIGTLYEELVET